MPGNVIRQRIRVPGKRFVHRGCSLRSSASPMTSELRKEVPNKRDIKLLVPVLFAVETGPNATATCHASHAMTKVLLVTMARQKPQALQGRNRGSKCSSQCYSFTLNTI